MTSSSPFQNMFSLPENFPQAQCIALKRELLIFGKVNCYSYHTRGNQYRWVCKLPRDYPNCGYCVVNLPKTNGEKETTLWMFGGYNGEVKMMKYVSVWKKKTNVQKLSQVSNANGQEVCINRGQNNFRSMRAVIGGRNNNLLFITYSKSIDVFNINTYTYVATSLLPVVDTLLHHCFVLKTTKHSTTAAAAGRLQKKANVEMLLFCKKTGLSINYDEDRKKFDIAYVHICSSMRMLHYYAFVCANGMVLFFGGVRESPPDSADVYKYVIEEDKWVKCEQALPYPLTNCTAVVSGDHEHVHIIGSSLGSVHLRTKLKDWMRRDTKAEKLWIVEEEDFREIEKVNCEINDMQQNANINNLK
ncbi:hypothetical protein RFI_18871, partial [Reticulomyxa filosa]